MARKLRWTIAFSDTANMSHSVNIYQEGYTGSSTLLTCGAPSMFEISEDDNDDLLSPLRITTGYIRLEEDTLGELSDLLPVNATSHYVVASGFCGYLQPQTFSNKWEDGAHFVNLPVTSLLGLAGTTYLDPIPVPSVITLRKLLYMICTKMGYKDIILPAGVADEPTDYFVDTQLSSLCVSPYADDNDYQYTDADFMAPLSVAAAVEGICTYFGFIAHDIEIGSYPALLLAKPNYEGSYHQWSDVQLAGTSAPSSPFDVTGATVRDFFNTFEVGGADNTQSLIPPFSRITYDYGGKHTATVDCPYSRSKYVRIMTSSTLSTLYLLTPVGGWLNSATLVPSTTNSFTYGTALAGIKTGNGTPDECILIRQPSSGRVQDSEMFSITFYERPVTSFFVTLRTQVASNYNTFANTILHFGLGLRCNGKYWDFEEAEWVSEKRVYHAVSDSDGTFQSTFVMTVNPLDAVELVFFDDLANEYFNNFWAFFDIKLDNMQKELKYSTVNYNKPTVINGVEGAPEEATVSCLFSPNNTTNRIYPATAMPTLRSTFLVQSQRRIEVDVVENSTYAFDRTHYLCKWDFGDGIYYRLIAVSHDVADRTRRLIFQGNELI